MPGAIGQIALLRAGRASWVRRCYSLRDHVLVSPSLSFWIVRAQGLIYGYYNLVNISRYPAEVFGGAFRWIFTWIIPVVVVANFPARILARPAVQPLGLMLELLAVTALAVGFSRAFWLVALRRYSSASS